MIFVTVGTHVQFDRLIKKVDELSQKTKEKIIIQRGASTYMPKNCESFSWDNSLDKYMEKARLVITHGGLSILEALKKHKKPTIIVPRRYIYGEHINDHQVEFSEVMEKKYGVKVIYDINKLTNDLIKNYRKITEINNVNLKKLQNKLRSIIELVDN